MRASAASLPKMPVYSRRCCSTASSDIAPVTLTGSTSENQSPRVSAISIFDLAWLRPRAVVMKQRASVVFDHDWCEIGPRRRIAQRPLGKRDAGRRAPHRRVVPIGTNHLPGRPILEADEHFRFIGVDAQFVRERFVNATLAGVRINRSPDCLTALRKRGQHMPIGRWLVDHGRRGPMQTNVILT